MNSHQIQSMHQVLHDPPRFQREYGDHGQTLAMVTLPDSLWTGLTLRNWTFEHVVFDGTRFDTVVFENATFDHCEFRKAVFKGVLFKNCRFNKPVLRGGKWARNTFSGGEMSGFDSKNEIEQRISAEWIGNVFENFYFHDNHPGPDAGIWYDCVFRDSRLENNAFGESVDPTLQDQTAWSTSVESISFERCHFKGNNWRQSFTSGTIRDCTIDGDDFDGMNGIIENATFKVLRGVTVEGNVHDCQFESSVAGDEGFGMSGGRNVVARNFQHGFSINNSEDVTLDGSQAGNLTLQGSIRRATVRNITAREFDLEGASLEDVVFENVNAEDLFLEGAVLKRCTFRNITISTSVFVGKKAAQDPVFEDCKFENVHRLPGTTVNRMVKERAIGYVLPWESAPGVSK
jgi:uncharacterized protein YjbI with pentapeptide repeats